MKETKHVEVTCPRCGISLMVTLPLGKAKIVYHSSKETVIENDL